MKLEKIREDANGDAKKIVRYVSTSLRGLNPYSDQISRAFRHIVEKDQKEHGVKNDKDKDLEDTVDAFQKKVDDLLDIDVVNASTSAEDA